VADLKLAKLLMADIVATADPLGAQSASLRQVAEALTVNLKRKPAAIDPKRHRTRNGCAKSG
jgi:hypothetical protein